MSSYWTRSKAGKKLAKGWKMLGRGGKNSRSRNGEAASKSSPAGPRPRPCTNTRTINHSARTTVAESSPESMERGADFSEEVVMADFEDADSAGIILPEDLPEEAEPDYSIEDYCNGTISDQDMEAAELSPSDSHLAADKSTVDSSTEQLSDSADLGEVDLMQADYASSSGTSATSAGGNKAGPKRGQKIQPRQTEKGDRSFECPKCSLCFGNELDLNNHINEHNKESKDPNMCIICSKKLSSASSLERHMLVHSGHRPFKCRICKMDFTTNGNMHRHMRTHARHAQQQAAAQLAGKAAGPGAMRVRPGRGRGGMGSVAHNGARRGRVGRGSSMARWDFPSLVHPQAPTYGPAGGAGVLGGSVNSIPQVASTPQQGPLAAVVHPSFSTPILNIHPAFGLEHCRLSSLPPVPARPPRPDPVSTAAQGEAAALSELQCPVCKQHFMIENSLDHHLATNHNINGRCRKCGVIFRKKLDLKVHMETLHIYDNPKVPKEAAKPPPKSPPSAPPNEARSGFHDLVMLPSTEPKFHLYAKASCDKSPRKGCNFFGNNTCDVCGNAFPTLRAMKMHRAEHSAGSMTSCRRCDVTFATREELDLHMIQHSASSVMEKAQQTARDGAEVKDLMGKENFLATLGLVPTAESAKVKMAVAAAKAEASLCSQQTNRAYFPAINQITPKGPAAESAEDILARMQRNGMPVGLVASASSVLGSGNAVVVANGAAAHPGPSSSPDSSSDKSFSCKYCEEVFPTKKELSAHVRNHKGVAPYQCDQCPYKSTDKSTLKRHHLTHTGERPHVCTLCSNAFTTKANCERHIRKKHNHAEKEVARKYVRSLPRQSTLSDGGAGCSLSSSPENGNSNAAPMAENIPCYQCKLCKIGFLSHFLAQKHVEHRHNVHQTKMVSEMLQRCDTCKGITMATDEDSIASSCSTPDYNRLTPQSYCSTPPRAHSTPPGAVHTPPPRAHHALTARPLPATVTLPPPLLQQVKVEPAEADDSFDNHCQPASASKEEPMDLTTKSTTPERQAASASAAASSASKDREGKSQVIQKKCLLTELRNQLLLGMRASDQNNNSLQPALASPASRAPITMLALQAPLASPPNPYALLSSSAAILSDSASPDRSGNYGSDSSSDLASINRIIDATNTNFRRFLPSDGDEERGQPSPGRKRPRDDDDDDEDEDAMIIDEYDEDEDEMDKDDAETARLLEEACGPGEGSLLSRKGMSQGLRQWRPPTSASNSPDDSNTGSGSTSREGQEPKPKKKRNSYADTPHNLHCDFPGCTRSFPWRSSLNRHMSTHTGDKPHKCDYCDMQFSTKSNRERHLVRKHGVNMCDPAARQTMDRPFKCHICTFSSFATESNLRKHYQERHNGESPPALSRSRDMAAFEGSLLFPPKSVGSNNEESSQMGDQEDKAHSPRSNASRNGLSEGESAMGFDGTPAENNVEEDEEDEEEEDEEEEDFNGDNSGGTSEGPVNPERDNYNVDKITSCWKCKNEFESRKLLLRHLKEHNIDLPFKCYLCDASYDGRRACLRHMQQEHGKPWLQVSRKNRVSSIPQFAAKMDDKVERNCRLSQLLSAGADVSGLQQEGEAKAGEEGSSEGVTADYVQRKVYCSFCPKRFWSLQDLRRHMRSHTGERPYKCSNCKKRFTLKHSMTRHQTKNRRCGCGSPALSEGSGAGDDTGVRPAAEAGSVEQQAAGIMASHSLLLSKLAAKSSPGLHFSPTVQTAATSSTVTKKASQASSSSEKKAEEEEEDASTMLPSLLGMEQEQLDQLLNTSYHDAAKMLGVTNGNPAAEEDKEDEADAEAKQ